MRRRGMGVLGILALLGLVLGTAGEANAVAITPGSVLYEGPVDYVFTSPANTFPNTPGTIISKTLTSLSQTNRLTWASSAEQDFAGGFRLSERIQNNSGQAWSTFSVTLDTGDYVTVQGSPTRVTIVDASFALPPNPTVTQVTAGTTVALSNGDRTVTFSFAAPVLHGTTLEIHIPIENLTTAALGGRVVLTETATTAAAAVPEPGTLLLIGSGLAGIGVLRRKRWFSRAGA